MNWIKKQAYLYKVMPQKERGSSGEISIVDASLEHLEDPRGSKTSSHQHNIKGKTWL